MKKVLYQLSRFCLYFTSVLPARPIVNELENCFSIQLSSLPESLCVGVVVGFLLIPVVWIDRRYGRNRRSRTPASLQNPS